MEQLILVTGPPGAGKSTVAAAVSRRFARSVLVDGDAFFGFLAEGAVPPWLPESQEQNDVVITAAAVATGAFARGGYPTVYDGVLGPWFLPQFLDRAALVALEYALLLPSEGVCVDRVRRRVGHGFTDVAATRKMHVAFDSAEFPRHHVLDSTNMTAEETVDELVRRIEQGQLRYPRDDSA